MGSNSAARPGGDGLDRVICLPPIRYLHKYDEKPRSLL
jgi:hypothetical protein